MTEYEFHELAAIFPLLSGDGFTAFVEDIRAHGLIEPIELYEGKILDGRNRYAACIAADVEPRFVTYDGDDPLGHVVSKNLHRRHLNESQRAMVAARMATLPKGLRADRVDAQICASRTQLDAADTLHVSRRSVQSARKVLNEGASELVEAVEQGEIAVSQAAQIAKMPEEEQPRRVHQLISQSNTNEWYTPPEYIEAACTVMGDIDCDPASNETAQEWIQAATYYTAETDGLRHDWHGRVWLNPPWGRQAGEFVAKLTKEIAAGRVTEAIVLVNAHSTDANWFRPLWDGLLCFTDHRINYRSLGDNDSGSTHGSVFVYFGPNREGFLQQFSRWGAVMEKAQ